MENRKTYDEKARTWMIDLFHQIKVLEEKAQKFRDKWTNEVELNISDFKDKKGKNYQEYEKLKSSGNEAFTEMKHRFETAMDALSEAFRKASTHFK